METAILSSTGQVVIPESVRELHCWQAGTEFTVEDTPLGLLLKPKKPFPETKLEDGLGCVGYKGPALSLGDIDNLLEQDLRRSWGIE